MSLVVERIQSRNLGENLMLAESVRQCRDNTVGIEKAP